jgi:hypothetical protein
MNRISRRLLRFAYVNTLPAELFKDTIDIETSKNLFQRFVTLVEIENHSYSNRTCFFCPNSFVDRRSEVIPFSQDVFHKILSDLASINFRQTLVWARYHEPLAHESIYSNISIARQALPLAFLTIHTNADYLNADSLNRLAKAGLSQVRINLYVPNGEAYTNESVSKLLKQLEHRTGLLTTTSKKTGRLILAGSPIDAPIHIPNFTSGDFSTRGGTLKETKTEYIRTSACLSPIQHVVVDYNGEGVLCCQTRSDIPEHKQAVIGDLNQADYSLFHFYRDLGPDRLRLVRPGTKGGVCKRCDVNLGGPDHLGRLGWLANSLNQVPGKHAVLNNIVDRRQHLRRYEFLESEGIKQDLGADK